MTKKKAIIKFCIIGFCIALGLASIFASFRLPFQIKGTYYEYRGLYGAIESKMGIDLKGGVMAVFECKPQDDNDTVTMKEVKATETRLLNALTNAGLTEATVTRQGNEGNYKIRVEVPGLGDTEEIFTAIGTPATLDFRKENSDTATPLVDAKDIKSVAIYQDQTTRGWGVRLNFSTSGGRKFRAMITDIGQGGSTYIFRSDAAGPKLFTAVTVQDTNAGTGDTTVITLGEGHNSQKDAEKFKLELESGLFDIRLDIAERSIIPQTLGDGALTGSIIALVIGLLFILLFMFVRYGDLGLLSNLALFTFLVLFLLSLAIVPAVQLTLPGIAGIILSIAMSVDANIIIFERIKDEYRSGKRLSVAMENGFNKSFWTIFDSNITTVIGAVVLFFLGTGPIKGFAITLMLGIGVSMFCSLLVTRSFAKLYLYLNSSNARRLKFENNNKYMQESTEAVVTPIIKPKRKLNFGESK